MGAWGTGPFDNDDAADLLGDLADESTVADVVDRLNDAMREILDSGGYLDSADVSRAIAAAAVIAASRSTDVLVDGDARDQIDGFAIEPDDTSVRLAAATLERALDASDNEWYDLNDEAGLVEETAAALAPLRAVLSL